VEFEYAFGVRSRKRTHFSSGQA